MAWIYVLALGALMASIGIAMGAFGAHALKEKLTIADLTIFDTAARYFMYSAFGVCIVGLTLIKIENKFIKFAAGAIGLGGMIFSGSLLILIFTGIRSWGAVTPVGGSLLIIGWLCLAIGLVSH